MERYRNEKKRKNFEKEMMNSGRIPNIIAALIISLYTLYFAGLPRVSEYYKVLEAGGIALVIIVILEFIIAPRTNHLLTKDITELIESDLSGNLSCSERTKLVYNLMKCPVAIGIQVAVVFAVGSCFWIILLHHFLSINFPVAVFSIAACFYGSCSAGILSYTYAERLCTHHACLLTAKGIDNSFLAKKHFFGLSTYKQVILFIIGPVIITNILQFIGLWKLYHATIFSNMSFTQSFHDQNLLWKIYRKDIFLNRQDLNMLFFVILNTALFIVSSNLLYKRVIKSLQRIIDMLEKMNNRTVSREIMLPTNLEDETAYNLYLINGILHRLQSISDDAAAAGHALFDSIQELSVSSKETTATSVEQAAGVKESVSSMESAEALSETISDRIAKVTAAAKQTTSNVQDSFKVLTGNIQKMTEITESNLETITGIKTLSDKIEKVWGIVAIINTIADKTRIIAFNAELEASTAGETGQNFHIVANEIRRLADSITDSTKEIRRRITEIQHSSDNLIITSEGGTERIREGTELFLSLQDKFKGIQSSSEITAESASDIQQIIDAQSASFIQIVTTLQQISAGVDNFTHSTKTVSVSAENLRQIATELELIKQHSKEGKNGV